MVILVQQIGAIFGLPYDHCLTDSSKHIKGVFFLFIALAAILLSKQTRTILMKDIV
jgi:hypothetical protein